MLTRITNLWNNSKTTLVWIAINIIVVVGGLYYIHDLRKSNQSLNEEKNTLDVNFKKLGDSYQTQGAAFASQQAGEEKAREQMGKTFESVMEQAHNQLAVLYTANAQLKDEVKNIHPINVTPDKKGDFSVKLDQVRTGPSLTSLNLAYDPSNTDASKRLLGTWDNNREDFSMSLGEWVKKDTSGYVAGIRMRRTVYRKNLDGTYTAVGEEELPLINGQGGNARRPNSGTRLDWWW